MNYSSCIFTILLLKSHDGGEKVRAEEEKEIEKK